MRGSVTRYTIKGSIRPRWRYRVYVGKDEQGNKVWEGRGGFQKQAEANEALRLHIEGMQLRANTAVSSPGPVWTLDSWLQHWLNDYGPARCQPKTLERYRQLVRYIPDSLGQIPLSKLSHTDLESAFFALRKAPGKRRLHLSARTVHHVAGFVNVALNKAFRLAILSVNPMLRVELPPTERKGR